MLSMLELWRVNYECSCGEWIPLSSLYLCRHCVALRCSFCVGLEIDASFCPYCLENMATGEARQKKNRCSNCLQCPICRVAVVVRTVDQLYHLQCNTCRWSTREAGIPDQTVSSPWPEFVCADETKLNTIQDWMKQLATLETAEKERHRTKRRSNLGSIFSDKHGLQAIYNRRKAGIMAEKTVPCPTMESTDEVPELDVDRIGTLNLDQLIAQPLASGRSLLPIRTHLVPRKSVRCRECDHSLCKGEYSPASIKFKIQALAIHHVPDIRLAHDPLPDLRRSTGSRSIMLSIRNFSSSIMTFILLPLSDIDGKVGVKCQVPSSELTIANRDETAEYDEVTDLQCKDDPGFVVSRRRNCVCIRLPIEALSDTMEDDELILGLMVKYQYKNMVMDTKSPMNTQIVWLEHRVQIALGRLSNQSIA